MTDLGDRWSLTVPQSAVTRLCIGWAATLTVGSSDGFEVRVGGPCQLSNPAGTAAQLVPEGDPALMAPLLSLVRLDVVRTEAFKDGRLEIELADNGVLSVPAADDFEPWEIVGPHGARIVSLPGGSLAVWSPHDHG